MRNEIKLRFYNQEMKAGYNDFNKVYSIEDKKWYKTKVHVGRLVYSNKRIPFTKLQKGVLDINYIVEIFCPF